MSVKKADLVLHILRRVAPLLKDGCSASLCDRESMTGGICVSENECVFACVRAHFAARVYEN